MELTRAHHFFLEMATVIRPKTPMAMAGPTGLSDRNVHTANPMQSSPTIRRSFLISAKHSTALVKKKEAQICVRASPISLVAGVGFEPTTFGL